MNLDDPVALALLTAEHLSGASVEHALYGGLALAAYGRPRETKDADVAVLDATASAARAALESAGLLATVPFERVRFGGLVISRVTVVGEGATSGLNTVDLVEPRSSRFAQAVIDRSIVAPLRGRSIRVVSPEDFILLKLLSTRDTDVSDAVTVLRRSPSVVDVDDLEREVSALATEIPDHGIRQRWALARHASSSDPHEQR